MLNKAKKMGPKKRESYLKSEEMINLTEELRILTNLVYLNFLRLLEK